MVTTQITSCRNVISIEHSASAISVAFWLVLLSRKMKNYSLSRKTVNTRENFYFFYDKSSILPFSNTEIVLFVFQLIYMQ